MSISLCWFCNTPLIECPWVQSNGKEPVEGAVVEWHMAHWGGKEWPMGVVVECPLRMSNPELARIRQKEIARREAAHMDELSEECKEMLKLFDMGRSYRKIAEELGCSASTIANMVRKFGLKRWRYNP